MRVRLTTRLRASAEQVWEAVRSPATLQHVSRPLIEFSPVTPTTFPERWVPGTYEVEMRLFGVVPIGRQKIVISFPQGDGDGEGAPTSYCMRDNGEGQMAERWDHRITVTAGERAGESVYTDDIELAGRWLTWPLAGFAQLLYRHRQRRWRKLFEQGLG